MILEIPTNSSGNGYYGQNDSYEFDNDDYDGSIEIDGGNLDDDFSEYLWMENEEEFDKLEMQRLEEEALMEQCIEDMLADELAEREIAEEHHHDQIVLDEITTDYELWTHEDPPEICHVLSQLRLVQDDIENSTLNPLAAEFVPNVAVST